MVLEVLYRLLELALQNFQLLRVRLGPVHLWTRQVLQMSQPGFRDNESRNVANYEATHQVSLAVALLEVDQDVRDDVDDQLQTSESEGQVADRDRLEAGHANGPGAENKLAYPRVQKLDQLGRLQPELDGDVWEHRA